MEFDVFYDYLCPFVYRASILIENVLASGERDLKVGWRYFSLAQVNSKEDGWTVWDAPAGDRVKGRNAFKGAEAARRQGRFDDFHLPMLLARHRDRLDIDQIEVVERVAVEAGLDLDRFRRDIADPDILDALARDHRQAVAELGVFGTPTFVFQGGASAYVRLSEPPDPADALRVFDALVRVAALEPGILEIKRPNKPSPD
jgi:predicted DsbA family dithiol-disulfide isomerase